MPITNSVIQTLTNSTKDTLVYPRTLSSAVIFENGNLYGGTANETLDTTLDRVVLTNTAQTITGAKTFESILTVTNDITSSGSLTMTAPATWPSNLSKIILQGANSKDFSFKISGNGTNVDVGWDWATGAGSGLALRSSNFSSTGQGGAFVLYARSDTTSEYSLRGYTSGLLTWNTASGSANAAKFAINASSSDYTLYVNGTSYFTNLLTLYRSSTTETNSPAGIKFSVNDTTTGQTYSSAYLYAYQDHGATTYGTNMVLHSGGNTIIGAGEAGNSVYTNAVKGQSANTNITAGANGSLWSQTGENLILAADGGIYFLTNCNTIANRNLSYLTTGGAFYATTIYGAVWNDYAEFRQSDVLEPGRCVREVGDDTMVLSTERLQKGCKIISDTFGFAIGETDKCKTPIAVSGRALVYIYEGRENAKLHIGDPVCSGPNGTVSIMTEDEEQKYPSRIVGIISAIPDYETWGSNDVPVNGRIWIYVK